MPKFNDNVSYPNKPNPELLDSFLITDFNDNKRTKTVKFEPVFELIADYFNNTDSPLSQNNVFRFVNLSVVIGDATNPTPTEIEYEQILLDKINLAFQNLNLTILQTELIIFKVNAISYGTFNTREIKYFMPAPIGKGVYEPLSDFITAEDLEIAYRQNATTGVTPPIVIGAPGMYVFELGDITMHGLSILDFLNTIQDTAWPNGYDLSDTNTLYFFNYTLGSSEYLMFFDAANSANGNGFYGDQGDFLFTSTDLVLLYDSSTPSPVVVDAVPEAPVTGKYYARRNLTWREIFLKNIADMPSLTGNAGKVFTVNITENGFEWTEMTSGGVGTLQQVLENGQTYEQIPPPSGFDYLRIRIQPAGFFIEYRITAEGIDKYTVFGAGSFFNQDSNGNTASLEVPVDVDGNFVPSLVYMPETSGYEVMATRDWANSQGFEKQSNKGAANGYAPLGSDSKVPATNSRASNVTYNSANGVLTYTWADGSVQTIDLPVENLFQNASYNSTTKTLTLTTNGGGTVDIPLTDLVDLPEIQVSANANPSVTPSTGQRLYLRADNGAFCISSGGSWVGPYFGVTASEKTTWNGKQDALSEANFGEFSNGLTAKTTPIDADTFNLVDSADSNKSKKVSLSNFWTNYLVAKVRSLFATATDFGVVKLFTSTGTATDGAMTQKAVTDALVLKADKFYIEKLQTSSYITGTVVETEILKITIPANTFSATDLLKLHRVVFQKIGTAGSLTVRFKLSTSATMPSGTTDQIGVNVATNTNIFIPFTRTFFITGGNLLGFPFTTNGVIDNNVSTAISSATFDRTVTQYLYVSVTLGNASDQVRILGGEISNV